MLIRFIVLMIASFILAKIIGVGIKFIRSLLNPHQDTIAEKPAKKTESVTYDNIQDVDYVEIKEKK